LIIVNKNTIVKNKVVNMTKNISRYIISMNSPMNYIYRISKIVPLLL